MNSSKVLMLAIVLILPSACNKQDDTPTQVSEIPASENVGDTSKLKARPSRINIRTRIRLSDIQSMIESELPAKMDGTGEQRQCKRVLGIKLCGTAQWVYAVERGTIITQAAEGDRLALQVPLAFNGNAGIQGPIAKTLNLSKLDFSGALLGDVKLSLDLDKSWCPNIKTDITYQWQSKPEVEWVSGLDMDLSKHLDKAIAKQLAGLDEKLKQAIDCIEFKANIANNWRNYSFPIDIPNATQNENMHLNLHPIAFAFSGLHTAHV